MAHPFKLSTFNKAYIGFVALVAFALFIAFSEKTPFQVGQLTGELLSCLLFPLLLAWIVWGVTGRREKGGRLTFTLVLTLILFGRLAQFEKRGRVNQEFESLQTQKEELKKELLATDDPEEIDAAFNGYVQSGKDAFDRLSKTSSGDEKKFYIIMRDIVTEAQTTTQNWNDAFRAVQSPDILDLSILVSGDEFARQSMIVRSYIEQSTAYSESVATYIPRLKKRLSVLGDGNEIATEAIKGATEKLLLQKPILEPLMRTHIAYGNNMLQILELLQKNQDDWDYDNAELSIYSDDVSSDFDELADALGANEEAINSLSEKLIDGM